MSFCPKCKSEYINGRAECADCNVPLVESLEELLEENISDASLTENPMGETYLENDSEENDSNANDSFEQATTDNTTNDDEEETINKVHAYVSKEDKYKDYLSTGYTFLSVGLAGIVVVTLNLLNVIHLFYVGGASAILFYTVMYVMFTIFIFVGLNSFASSKRLKQDAATEDQFINELKSFITENITKESLKDVDASAGDENFYFNCTEAIKNVILEKYPDIDAALLEKIADDTFDQLFS